jgi:hypothetical protein
MAKRTNQNPSDQPQAAELTVDETPAEQQERLKRAVDGVQAALTSNRAVINVTRLNLIEGRLVPEVQIQILR